MTSHSWPDVVVVASVRDQDLAPLVRFIDALEALSGGALAAFLRDDADARDVLNQWVGAPRGRPDYDDRAPACDLLVHSRHLWAIGGRVGAPAHVEAYLGGRPRLDAELPVPEVPPKVSGRGWVEARMWIHPRHGHRGGVVAQVGRLEPSPTLRYTFDGTSHALAPAYRVAARADDLVSLANFACWLRAALRADVLAISTTLAFDVHLLDQPRPPPLNRGGFDLLRQPARSVEDDRYESERARSHGLGVTESAALLDLVASVRDCMASPPMYGTMLGVYRVVRQIVEDIYRPIGAAPIIAAEARRMLLAEALEAYQQRLQHSAMFFGGARLHDAVPPGVAKVSGWIEVLVGAVFGIVVLAGARCVTLVRFGLAEEMAVQSFGRNVVVARARSSTTWSSSVTSRMCRTRHGSSTSSVQPILHPPVGHYSPPVPLHSAPRRF